MNNTMLRTGVFAVCGVLLVAKAVGAQDWPQWRGPNRDNHVTGFTEPKTWPKELTQKWKVKVGEGLASPVLVGDKVFVFASQDNDEVTLCLEAASGKELWKDKYAAPSIGGAAGRFPIKGPRSAPAVADGKVCTVGVDGTVSCLDAASGKKIWRNETKSRPKFYVSASPVVVDGVCVAQLSAGLTAFDLASGEKKWQSSGIGEAYGSPAVATLGGVKQVVMASDRSLVGIAAADGKQLWKTAFSVGRYPTATPVIDGSTVIAGGIAFTVEKKGDEFTVTQLWKDQAPHPYCTPVLKDGLIYGFSGRDNMDANGKLYCQDAKTGKVLWADTAGRGQSGYILDAGTVLVALNTDSNLLVFKPSKEGYMEVTKYKVADSPTWAEPILAGNRVFVKDRDNLILWTIE
jgi:outer membrane protein assembly factor BamB